MENETNSSGDLHDFYRHLGEIVINGREDGGPDESGKDWAPLLSQEGYEELSALWDEFLSTSDDDNLYRESLLKLISATGDKLREPIRPTSEENEIASGDDELPCALLPETSETVLRSMDDISYLIHALGVGSLRQKRAAAEALGNLLLRKKDPANRNMREEAAAVLSENRDPEVAFEVVHALTFAVGSEGKRAKAGLARTQKFMGKLHKKILSYWDGTLDREPLTSARSDDIVTLGIWMRIASDYVVGHVGEILVDLLAKDEEQKLAPLTAAFIYSADRRLLPVFVRILQDGTLPPRIEAIKALAHINDPRAFGSLEKAFRHSTDRLEKIILARALARMGSEEHFKHLEKALATEKRPEFLDEVLKAVGEMGEVSDETRDIVIKHLGSDNTSVLRAAIRAISDVGGENDIETLESIAREKPKMRAMITAAKQTLYSNIILRGSEIADRSRKLHPIAEEKVTKPGIRARFMSGLYYLLALICLVVRKREKSLVHVERSLTYNPLSCTGHFLKARIYFSMGNLEMSIETYRHAVTLDETYTWKKPDDADKLIRAYLRRSQEIESEAEGPQEALMILDELNDIDLRKADPNLKIEIGRRLDYLKLSRIRASAAMEEEE